VADWDASSPKLRQNLVNVLDEITRQAPQRQIPTKELARHWQRSFMEGLKAEPRYVGAFRGEPGLERTGVRIGRYYGVSAKEVAGELAKFEKTLQRAVARLDAALPAGKKLNRDEVAAVLDLCAWTHAEWIRIHPFANGNGRTARLWANFLAIMRYGLPPFVRLRPRPDDDYGNAGGSAMQGDWKPAELAFRRLLEQFFDSG
jgi:Fic/DOC family